VDDDAIMGASSEQRRSSEARVETRVFACECLAELLGAALASPQLRASELSVQRARKERARRPLAAQLPDLVTVACMAAGATYEGLRAQGLRLLSRLVEAFASSVNPDAPPELFESVLADYQAQIASCVRQGLSPDFANNAALTPEVRAASCALAVAFLQSGISRDRAVLQRIVQLLTETLRRPAQLEAWKEAYDESANLHVLLSHADALAKIHAACLLRRAAPAADAGGERGGEAARTRKRRRGGPPDPLEALSAVFESEAGFALEQYEAVLRDFGAVATLSRRQLRAHKGILFAGAAVTGPKAVFDAHWFWPLRAASLALAASPPAPLPPLPQRRRLALLVTALSVHQLRGGAVESYVAAAGAASASAQRPRAASFLGLSASPEAVRAAAAAAVAVAAASSSLFGGADDDAKGASDAAGANGEEEDVGAAAAAAAAGSRNFDERPPAAVLTRWALAALAASLKPELCGAGGVPRAALSDAASVAALAAARAVGDGVEAEAAAAINAAALCAAAEGEEAKDGDAAAQRLAFAAVAASALRSWVRAAAAAKGSASLRAALACVERVAKLLPPGSGAAAEPVALELAGAAADALAARGDDADAAAAAAAALAASLRAACAAAGEAFADSLALAALEQLQGAAAPPTPLLAAPVPASSAAAAFVLGGGGGGGNGSGGGSSNSSSPAVVAQAYGARYQALLHALLAGVAPLPPQCEAHSSLLHELQSALIDPAPARRAAALSALSDAAGEALREASDTVPTAALYLRELLPAVLQAMAAPLASGVDGVAAVGVCGVLVDALRDAAAKEAALRLSLPLLLTALSERPADAQLTAAALQQLTKLATAAPLPFRAVMAAQPEELRARLQRAVAAARSQQEQQAQQQQQQAETAAAVDGAKKKKKGARAS
jgi:hypothetical protein